MDLSRAGHLISAVPDAVIVIDEDSGLRYANSAAERLFGWRAEEWIGADFFSEIAPWTYHDRRETLHILRKYKPPTDAELHERAQDLREQNLME